MMKIRHFLWAATLAAVSACSGMAWAQDADTGAGTNADSGLGAHGGMRGRLNFLSADDRAHLLRVRQQVLADNPELKTEQENLMQQWKAARSGSDTDKRAMRGQMRDFREKMNAAMVKADPSVQPILDQIKEHMKERFQQRAAATGSGDGAGSQ